MGYGNAKVVGKSADGDLYIQKQEHGHCMSGVIRTREKCPVCSGKFAEMFVGKAPALICPACKTRPEYVHIRWYNKASVADKAVGTKRGRKHFISRNYKTGHLFTSYSLAYGVLEEIRVDLDSCTPESGRRFDIRKYLSAEVDDYRGRVLFYIDPKDTAQSEVDTEKITWLRDIQSRKPKRARSYLRKVEQYCKDFFIPFFGDRIMTEIDNADVARFQRFLGNYRIKTGRNKGALLSDGVVKNVMDQLRGFCIWLNKMKRDFIVPIFDRIPRPKRLPKIMPLEDRKKAFGTIMNKTHRAIIDLLIRHPIRPSEACALDVRHFDLESMTLFVENGLDYDRTIKTRKCRDEYVIPLDPHWDSSSITGRFGKEIAFPNKLGDRFTPSTLGDAWELACENAGVPYVNIYNATKHTTMTKWRREGKREQDLERMAGQSTPGMSRVYTLLCVEELRHMHGATVTKIGLREGKKDSKGDAK